MKVVKLDLSCSAQGYGRQAALASSENVKKWTIGTQLTYITAAMVSKHARVNFEEKLLKFEFKALLY